MHVINKNENDALLAMLAGVETLLETVGQSLGPLGKATAIISPDRDFLYTSHGIEIVQSFQVADSLEQVGVRFIRQAAQEVNRFAGDATTSATIVIGSLFIEAVKLITSGYNSHSIRSGINQALEAALDAIRSMSRPVKDRDELQAIACSASRGDERDIKAVMEAWGIAADHGYISTEVTEPKDIDHELQTTIGVNAGVHVPGILNGFTQGAEDDCPFDIVVLENDAFRILKPDDLLSGISGRKKPVLLFANSLRRSGWREEDDSNEILGALLAGAESQQMQLLVNVGDSNSYFNSSDINLKDVAAFAGTSAVSAKHRGPMPIGRVDNVKQVDKHLVLTGGQLESVEFKKHAENLKRLIGEQDYHIDQSRKRLASLLGKYVTITAFDLSVEARKERSTILHNVINAVVNAHKSGVVPGGGSALAGAASAISETRPSGELERFGFEAVRRALTRPLYWIVKNAGKEPTSLIEDIQRAGTGMGFDVKAGRVCDLCECGVVDPARNALAILQTSISTIQAMLNISSLIHIEEDDSMSEQDTSSMDVRSAMDIGGRRGRRSFKI